mmetsp:Transcript_9420/g.24291  ORF Transcript_9420/g.24291 Transcript_9420/m.24291 type:complete len:389 (+) Transcript_9420:107-1273(+)
MMVAVRRPRVAVMTTALLFIGGVCVGEGHTVAGNRFGQKLPLPPLDTSWASRAGGSTQTASGGDGWRGAHLGRQERQTNGRGDNDNGASDTTSNNSGRSVGTIIFASLIFGGVFLYTCFVCFGRRKRGQVSDRAWRDANRQLLGPLPPGWVVARDPLSGRPYYQNVYTRETQWDRPSFEPFDIGDRVDITGGGREGTVRWFGDIDGQPRIGVLLDEPFGNGDGTVGGVRRFSCEVGRGAFVDPVAAVRIGPAVVIPPPYTVVPAELPPTPAAPPSPGPSIRSLPPPYATTDPCDPSVAQSVQPSGLLGGLAAVPATALRGVAKSASLPAAPTAGPPLPALSEDEASELSSLKDTLRASTDVGAVGAAGARISEIERNTGVIAQESRLV